MLASTLREEKKDFLAALLKSASLPKKLVDKSLHPLLNKKNTAKIWTILENRFQHISVMSVTRIFLDAYLVKLSDCNNVINYTSRYQIAFDKLLSLLNTKSWMFKESIKMTLQESLLHQLGRDYAALVSAIETNWKNKTSDQTDTILWVIRHAEINKSNNKDNVDVKVLAINIHQAPKRTCIIKEYVEREVTTNYTDRCWVLHPELCAKYSLRQIQPRRLNRNLKKTNTSAESVEKREKTLTPEIDSWQLKVFVVEGP